MNIKNFLARFKRPPLWSVLCLLFIWITNAPLVKTSEARLCDNLNPGVKVLAQTVDITRLDLTPLNVYQPEAKGLTGHDIIQFTCDGSQMYKDTQHGIYYQIPDQVSLKFWNTVLGNIENSLSLN